jgi:hypothetical protein
MFKVSMLAVGLVAGLAAMPPVLAQPKKGAYYEPSQRLRTAVETCMKDEVMNGANCVKKCQADFKLDLTVRPPICFSNRPDAKYEPPKPTFVPPTKKLPQGAKGPKGADG